MEDERIVKEFKRKMGVWPDLLNPQTLSEKMLIRKLRDRRPLLVELTDKLKAKEYIEGKSAVKPVPTLATGFDDEPKNYPFIVKPNNYSGQTHLVTNQKQWKVIRKKLEKIKDVPFGQKNGSWAYGQIPFILMFEPVLEDFTEIQFFCFNGQVKIIRRKEAIHIENNRIVRADKHAYFSRLGGYIDVLSLGSESCGRNFKESANLKEMVKAADTLTSGIDFVRFDMYWTPDTLYFAEYTFYPAGGHFKFTDQNFDKTLGDMWKQ